MRRTPWSAVAVGLTLLLICTQLRAEVALGPFASPEDLEAAQQVLSNQRFSYEPRVDEERESLGYIVVTEVLDEQAGRDRVEAIKAAGIRDVVRMAVGVYSGRVSAGVFGLQQSAQRRVEQLGASGFRFDIMERTRLVHYEGWLDVEARSLPQDLIDRIEEAQGYALTPLTPVPALLEPEPTPAPAPEAGNLNPTPSIPAELPVAAEVVDPPAAFDEPIDEPEPTVAPAPVLAEAEKPPTPAPEAAPPVEVSTPAQERRTPTVTLPPETDAGTPWWLLLIGAIVFSAGAALAYTWFQRRSQPVAREERSKSVLIEYDQEQDDQEQDDQEGEHEDQVEVEPPIIRDAVTVAPSEEEPEPVPVEPSPLDRFAEEVLGNDADNTRALLAAVDAPSPGAIELIDDLMHLARAEREGSVEVMLFDLDAFVTDMVDRARYANGDIGLSVDGPLPVVRADAGKIQRVFNNLLARCHASDFEATCQVKATIRDPDCLELRIFNGSTAASESEEDWFDRTTMDGMRMSVGRRIAKLIGAEVSVERDAGVVVFIADIPVIPAESEITLSTGQSIAEVIEADAAMRLEIEATAASLEAARLSEAKATEALEAHTVAEAQARERASALENELAQARQGSDEDVSRKEALVAEATARVEELQQALASAQHAASNENEQLAAIRDQLTETERRLEEELAGRAQTEREASGFVGRLTNEVESLKANIADAEARHASASEEAAAEIERLKAELAESQLQLDDVDAREAEKVAELEQRNRELMVLISDAEEKQEAEQGVLATEEESRKLRLEELETALVQAKEEAAEHGRARTEIEQAGQKRAAALMKELKRTQRKLEEASLKRSEDTDIEALQFALTQAEDGLAEERKARTRAEKESTSYIDELMNDLNRARADMRKEARAREEIELAFDERLDAMGHELEDTRRRLIAESAARQRAEERAKAADARQRQRQEEAQAVVEADETGDEPITSTMPMNNPILRSMAERFVVRLDEQLETLEDALDEGNPAEMLQIANWIKGEAYTLGFLQFVEPVNALEENLKDKAYARVPSHIVQLKHMAGRVHLGDEAEFVPVEAAVDSADAVLRYELPANPRKAEMMENFIAQLGTQLLELEVAVANGRTSDRTRITRWILKYASAFDLKEIVDAVDAFNASADNWSDDVDDRLVQLSALYSTIEIVK